MNHKLLSNFLGWFFGMLFSAIAVVNIFWGNDSLFGVFLFLLSLLYYPPLNVLFKNITGYTIANSVKIVLGIFILWASFGVGELLNKIGLMMHSF